MKPKVYFSREIKPETISKLYILLNVKLEGPVAFKLHSRERGNQNFITPDFFKSFIDEVGGTVVDVIPLIVVRVTLVKSIFNY